MGVGWVVWGLNKSTKNATLFNLFTLVFLGYLFTTKQNKLFFRLLFCTLVHMAYIASPALHRSRRSGSIECHSRWRVCIVCGGKWVEWDVTSGGYEKITRVEYWKITTEWGLRGSRAPGMWWGHRFVTLARLVSQTAPGSQGTAGADSIIPAGRRPRQRHG